MRRTVLVGSLVLLSFACGKSNDPAADGPRVAPGVASTEQKAAKDPCTAKNVVFVDGCPSSACSCPAHCAPQIGEVWDDARRCMRPTATFACKPASSRHGDETSAACWRRLEDGLIVFSSGSFRQPGWGPCTDADEVELHGPNLNEGYIMCGAVGSDAPDDAGADQ